MIYISSGCSQKRNIISCIEEIKSWGYSNIELTGNIENFHKNNFISFYKEHLEGNTNLRTHNYFPAPQKPFVMNFSGNEDVQEKTINLVKEAWEYSLIFKNKKLGFHAGFRLDPNASDLGRKFKNSDLISKKEALRRMCKNIESITFRSEVYIENNVYSDLNKKVFGADNPFLLCSYGDYLELNKIVSFNLLLDIGHLKVSCHSLGLDYEKELTQLLEVTNYIHVSDNNGLADENHALQLNSDTYKILKKNKDKLRGTDFTVEVYSGQDDVHETFKALESLLG